MAKKQLEQCGTIPDLVDYEKTLELKHDSLYLKSRIEPTNGDPSFVLNTTAISTKYLDVILKCCVDVELTERELLRYRYQPKLYCYENYGNIELWSLLLKVNNMLSASEFSVRKIKGFDVNTLTRILNEILILEDNRITKNEISLLKD